MPTRSQDYYDLTNSTQLVLKKFMTRTFKEYPLSILVDFQTEFVRTGVSSGSEIFVVFQSTAVFDFGSFVIPEASQVEGTLREALDKDKELWLEYISALQELDPENAFSSVVNVVYSTELPPEPNSSSQSSSSTSSAAAIGAAAAGVAVVLIAVFVIKRRRDTSVLADNLTQPQKKHRSRFFNNGNSAVTVAETTAFDVSSEAVRLGSTTSPDEELHADVEEGGTISSTTSTCDNGREDRNETLQDIHSIHNSSGDYNSLNVDQSARANSDWDEYRTYSFNDKEAPEDENADDYSNYSVDAITSQSHSEESIESMSLGAAWKNRSTKRWEPWRKQSSARTKLETDKDESPLQIRSNAQALNNLPGKSQELSFASDTKKDALDRQVRELNAQTRLQEDSKKQEEADFAKKKADLEEWVRKEQVLRLQEEDRLANERLQAELAKIKAEEAARTAEELRLKEERRFAAEKEAFEARLKLQEKARRIEEQKLRRVKANFEALILEEKKERLILEQRLAEEEKAADAALQAAEEKARRAELKIAEATLELNAAKEALEIKQQEQQETESGLLLKEEEEYLKRIRAEELARAENIQAEKEAALAVDIRKLQQRKFEEKQKTLDALRAKEASGGILSHLKISSQIEDKDVNERASLLDAADDAVNAERLAIAIRLAQSWDSPSVVADIPPKDIGMRPAQSWDSATIQESRKDVHYQSHSDSQSTCGCDDTDANKAKPDGGDADDGGDAPEVAVVGARNSIEDQKDQKGPVKEKLDVSARSARRPRTLQDYDTSKPVRKIGPAQFISPWSDDTDIADGNKLKEKGKRRKHRNTANHRPFNFSGRDVDNFSLSESKQSQEREKNLDSDIRSGDSETVTSESVVSDDSCSIYSARTNATTLSGFSKILPR